jgi:hypothetical protein
MKAALIAAGVDTSACFERADLEAIYAGLSDAQKLGGTATAAATATATGSNQGDTGFRGLDGGATVPTGSGSRGSHHSATERTERGMFAKEGDPLYGAKLAEENARFERMSEMTAAAGLPPNLDSRIPAFHTEFAHFGEWPADADEGACRRRLALMYEHTRALP